MRGKSMLTHLLGCRDGRDGSLWSDRFATAEADYCKLSHAASQTYVLTRSSDTSNDVSDHAFVGICVGLTGKHRIKAITNERGKRAGHILDGGKPIDD